jgi:glutathione S-transferase
MSVLELWQTEWCPASRRIRQRLTELGLDVVLHQVPVPQDERAALLAATGSTTIPVLAAADDTIVGEEAILEFLRARFPEPAEADSHRVKAARARARDLEEACRQLTAATP